MARPTTEPKKKLVGIRIDEELEKFFVDGNNNISESIRTALKDYVKQKKGSVKQNSANNVKQNDDYVKHYEQLQSKFNELSARVVPEAEKSFKNGQYEKLEIVLVGAKSENSIPGSLYDSIMSMVSTYGMTYEEFMKIIDEFLDKCFISYDGNEVYTVDSKLDTSGFIKKCDDNGIYNYQSAFDKIVKNTKFN